MNPAVEQHFLAWCIHSQSLSNAALWAVPKVNAPVLKGVEDVKGDYLGWERIAGQDAFRE